MENKVLRCIIVFCLVLITATSCLSVSAETIEKTMVSYDVTDELILEGDAKYDEEEEAILLCPAETWSNGKAKYPFEVPENFTLKFDYMIGGGSSADGIILAFFADNDAVVNEGQYLNFEGCGGYAVEFDTYRNKNDSSEAHVAVIHEKVSNHLVMVDEPRVDDEEWHTAEIKVEKNDIIISIDGDIIIDETIEFDKTYRYIYFAATTGASTDNHYIKNVRFTGTIYEDASVWAKPEINEAFEKNLIPEPLIGKDLTEYISRAEFAALSVQLYEELTGKKIVAEKSKFDDISDNENENAINKAYHLNITDGMSATSFEPDIAITREQLATMLCRTIKKYSFEDWSLKNDEDYYLDTSGVEKFADDAEISSYAKPSVYYMTKFGIIHGIDETHFAPKNMTKQQEVEGYATATREQAILLSLRIYNLKDLWNKK